MGAPALSIDITGKADKFQKTLDTVGRQADKTVASIEQRFAGFDPQLNTGNYLSSMQSMVGLAGQFAAQLGIGGLLAGGAAAGIGAVIALTVKLNQNLADTAALAERAGLSYARLQQDKFAASSIGVSDDSFNSSIEGFATNLQNAKFSANDLVRVFKANGVEIKNSNGELKNTNELLSSAYSIVQRQKTVQDAIQVGGFLGFSKDFSQSIQSAGDGFQQLAAKASAAGAVVDDATIQKAKEFTKQWNIASTAWSAGLRSAVGDILPLLNDAVSGAIAVINSIRDVYRFIEGIKNIAIHPDIDKAPLQYLQQYMDALQTLKMSKMDDRMGGTVPVSANVALMGAQIPKADPHKGASADEIDAEIAKVQKLIELKKQALDGPSTKLVVHGAPAVNPGPKQSDPGKDTFESEIDRLAKRTATINADTAATFQNNAAQASFRAEFQLLTAVMTDGGNVTQDQIDKYEKLRQSMSAVEALQAAGITLTAKQSKEFLDGSKNIGAATTASDKAKLSLSQLNSASQTLGSGLASAFNGAIFSGEKFNQVVTNLLKSLGSAGVNSIFASIFNAPAAGGLSPFLKLLGIGHNAEGTDNWGGGPTWVGERGPEILNLPRGAQVTPNNVATRAGNAGATNNINVAVTGATGNSEIQNMVTAGMQVAYQRAVAAAPGAVLKHQARFG